MGCLSLHELRTKCTTKYILGTNYFVLPLLRKVFMSLLMLNKMNSVTGLILY